MIFTTKFTTAWHDTDAFRRVRITKLLMYMQAASNCHMESCGPSLDSLRDTLSLAFILSKTRMSIYRPLYAFEEIEVQTFTGEGHGFAMPRFYRILRNGEVIAEADTTWALVNLKDGRLERADVLTKIYGFENDTPLSIDVPTRFKLPADTSLELMGDRKIVYSDLDYNMHMNNTRYTDMLCDLLPIEDTQKIRGVLLSYLHEGAFGDTLTVRHTLKDNTHYFKAQSNDGTVCLEAELIM